MLEWEEKEKMMEEDKKLDAEEWKQYFLRLVIAVENIANVTQKQQPGRLSQALTAGASGAGIIGILSAVEIIRTWISGGF
jgi:N-acetylmuramic acid 6-phosphate (MurNAc-6-P) etherase